AKAVGVEPRHGAADGEMDAGDALTGLERHARRGLELLRRIAGAGEPVRQSHRETARVRSRDQLLRAGARLASLGAMGPGQLQLGERATRRPDRSLTALEVAGPGRTCTALHCH